MQIDVKLFGILRDQVPSSEKGKISISLREGSSVADLLERLDITRRVEVAINEDIEPDGETVLIAGDQASIFTAIGGG